MWKPLPWWKFRAACLAGNSCDDWSRCLGFLFTRRLLFHTAINQPQFHHKHLVQTIPKWLGYNRFNLDSGVKFWIAIDMGFYYLVQSSHSRWKCLSSQRWKILLPRMTIWIRVTHAELFGTSNQELQGSCFVTGRMLQVPNRTHSWSFVELSPCHQDRLLVRTRFANFCCWYPLK